MDNDIDDLLAEAAFCGALATAQEVVAQAKKPRWYTALQGSNYVEETLKASHPARIKHVLRIQFDTFHAFQDWLFTNTHLKASRAMTVEEKLVVFLYRIIRPASDHAIQCQEHCLFNRLSIEK